MIPGMLFENMGILYLGPVDGHNIPAMVKLFKEASKVEGPVLVHVITEKEKDTFRQNAIRHVFMERKPLMLRQDCLL